MAYGAIGGVMVLMLWLYISGAVILLGIAVTAAQFWMTLKALRKTRA